MIFPQQWGGDNTEIRRQSVSGHGLVPPRIDCADFVAQHLSSVLVIEKQWFLQGTDDVVLRTEQQAGPQLGAKGVNIIRCTNEVLPVPKNFGAGPGTLH